MRSRGTRAFTTAELLVVCAICLIVLLAFGDAVSNAKYSAREASCKANFGQIGSALHFYQTSHAERMPPTLKALLPTAGSKTIFVCPMSPSEQTYPFRRAAYDYRFLAQPKGTDVICWDSQPHRPMHSVLVWLNRPNRNVLLADGQVKNMLEDDFEQLHLSGQSWIISDN